MPNKPNEVSGNGKRNLLFLAALVLMVTFTLLAISFGLYKSSGAAQLDLSRPGYMQTKTSSEEANQHKDFSATGEINSEVVKEFKALYDEQVEDINQVDAFRSEALSDGALGISGND
jgi:hypothetical protein